MKLVISFIEACKVTNENPEDPKFTTGAVDEIAHKKLKVVAKALNVNEDGTFWEPNWFDRNAAKWFPWWTVKASAKHKSGSGLVFNHAYYCYSLTYVGSRLCYKSREIVLHLAKVKEFKKLYEDFMLIK
jgi:hypothetical protein